MSAEGSRNAGMSRRHLMVGAAWATPAIVVATAIPAAASSESVQGNLALTAFIVNGTGSPAIGTVQANGVRVSNADGSLVQVAGNSVVTITITYSGSDPDFNFLDPSYGLAWNKGNNAAWTLDEVNSTATRLVFTALTPPTQANPIIGSILWYLKSGPRPADDSISITGSLVLQPGGDFPEGGIMAPLVIDPIAGTGTLIGPTPTSWPLV